jgi:hypothetical protein
MSGWNWSEAMLAFLVFQGAVALSELSRIARLLGRIAAAVEEQSGAVE